MLRKHWLSNYERDDLEENSDILLWWRLHFVCFCVCVGWGGCHDRLCWGLTPESFCSGITPDSCLGDHMWCRGLNLSWPCACKSASRCPTLCTIFSITSWWFNLLWVNRPLGTSVEIFKALSLKMKISAFGLQVNGTCVLLKPVSVFGSRIPFLGNYTQGPIITIKPYHE